MFRAGEILVSSVLIVFNSLLILLFLALSGCKKPQGDDYQQKRYIPPMGVVSQVYENKPVNLADSIKQELEKDPASVQRFLQEMVDLAVKKYPGMAIQVEKYASEEVKKEVERWKNDANVSNLLRLEEGNKRLKNNLSSAESSAKEHKQRAEKLKVELDKAVSEIQNLLVFRERFTDLQNRYNQAIKKINEPLARGVPVILYNTWIVAHAYFKIFDEKNKNRQWLFSVNPGVYAIVKIPPGDYVVEFYTGNVNNLYARESMTVTEHISVEDKYHGIAMTPL